MTKDFIQQIYCLEHVFCSTLTNFICTVLCKIHHIILDKPNLKVRKTQTSHIAIVFALVPGEKTPAGLHDCAGSEVGLA